MSKFQARVVLLGASNVTKGISVIVETAQRMLGSPLDVYCAIGHGRSYGKKSFVLVRSLPSIAHCGLWPMLGLSEDDVPMYALIADVGNDVMYGVQPGQIVRWVDTCVQRLQVHDARIVITGLPMQRISRLTPWQYTAARTLLFPGNRMTHGEAMERAQATSHELTELAAKRRVPLVALPASWYGVDPIHIRQARKAEAWRDVLSHWRDDEEPAKLARGSLRRWLHLRRLSPEHWWLWGMERGRPQPCATLKDGSRISLY